MTGSVPNSSPTREEIDSSCRAPLFALFASAAIWLLLASVFEFIASIKFHSPNFLADSAWLTYGRVHSAAACALLYGFAVPAGLAVALRIFAQLGRRQVFQPWLIVVGAKVCNLGVLAGVAAILAGDNNGFENLEMPRYAALLLFLGYLLIGTCTALTLHGCQPARLAAPQWFLLAALFWFPWIYSTANLLLLVFPVRGVEQSVIAWWYSGNLTVVWLSLVGLGAFFHFLNQSSDDGRQKDYRPLFVFWTLILFGGWVGIPSHAPVPVWMPTLSTVATVLTIVPLLTVVVILTSSRESVKGVRSPSSLSHPTRRAVALSQRVGEGRGGGSRSFILFGIVSWLTAGVMKIIGTLPDVTAFTDFTWYTVAQSQLNTYGFFSMTMFGALYCMAPQVTGSHWPWPKAIRVHFWCSAAGIVLMVLPLAFGGIIQGFKLNNPEIAFIDLTQQTLMFLRISTLGAALLAVGNLLLTLNLISLSIRYFRTHLVPLYAAFRGQPAPLEVNS